MLASLRAIDKKFEDAEKEARVGTKEQPKEAAQEESPAAVILSPPPPVVNLLPRDEAMTIRWKQRAYDASAVQNVEKVERVDESKVKLLLSKLLKLPVEALENESNKPFIQAQLRKKLDLEQVAVYRRDLFGGEEVYEKPLDAHFIAAVSTARQATSELLRENGLYRKEKARVLALSLMDPSRALAQAALLKQKELLSSMQEWAKLAQDTVSEMAGTSAMTVSQATAALEGKLGPGFSELQCRITSAQTRCKTALEAAGRMEAKTASQMRDIESAQKKIDHSRGIWPYAEREQKAGAQALLVRRKEVLLRGRDWAASERKAAAAAKAEASKLNELFLLGEFEPQQKEQEEESTPTDDDDDDEEAAYWKHPPLLHLPDRFRVEQIIRWLEPRDMRGMLELKAVVCLFSDLLGVEVSQIPIEHPDVFKFGIQMNLDEQVSFLRASVSKASIDKRYERLETAMAAKEVSSTTPLFPAKACKQKLYEIIEATDVNHNGMIDVKEAKHLLHRLCGFPKHQVGDHHPELRQLLRLSRESMTEELYKSPMVTPSRVDAYHRTLFFVPRTGRDTLAAAALSHGDGSHPSLLRLPSRSKLEMMIEYEITVEEDTESSSGAKRLFSNLLSIPIHDIPDDHPELVAWCKADFATQVDLLFSGSTDTRVSRYFEVLFAGKDGDTHMRHGPNYQKAKEVVEALKIGCSGSEIVRGHDVKLLFSRLLELDVLQIPDDHEGVLAFGGLTKDEFVGKLCRCASAQKIDQYHTAMIKGPQAKTAWPTPPPQRHQGVEARSLEAAPLLRPGMLPRWVPAAQGTVRPLHGGFVLDGVE